jgi:DNA repair protein RadC
MVREQSTSYRILDLDESERPRERLARLGAGSLSDAELLAILLRVGTQGENAVEVGQHLLTDFHGLRGLQRAASEDIQAYKGVGPAKVAQILAAIELGRRIAIADPEERPAVHSPNDAANQVLYEMSALEQEELWIILLDTRNRIIKVDRLYKGSINNSQVRVGEIFKTAIRNSAPSLIVVHNHPSGDPTPSPVICGNHARHRPGWQVDGYRCARPPGDRQWSLGIFKRARPRIRVMLSAGGAHSKITKLACRRQPFWGDAADVRTARPAIENCE